MKQTAKILCLILFVLTIQTPAQTKAEIFRGGIGDATFQMTLTRDGNQISGNYFYEKSGSANKLNLKGEIQTDGKFTLQETDAGGKQTGIFTGTWEDDETTSGVELQGNWKKPGGEELNFYAVEQNIHFKSRASIVTRIIKESNKPRLFDIDADYPEIVGANNANTAKFNLRAKQLIAKSLANFRKEMLTQTATQLKYIKKLGANYIDIGYTTEYASDDLISVQFSDAEFTGGVHPNHFSYTLNYDLKNGRELTLADLFKPKSDYLKVISDFCIAELKKQSADMSDDEWAKKGAGADAKNFESWNIIEKGLEITFNPYQVASYAAGDQTVIIPFEKLKDVLAENSAVNFLKTSAPVAANQEREKFDPARNAGADLTDAIAKAQKSNKRIILDVGGEWCIWCLNTDRFFIANPDLAKLRDENFIWLKINFSEENKNEAFLSAYPKVAGYPHLFVLDENGKLLHSQDTSELEAGKSYNLEVYTSFLKKWSPPKSADALSN